MKRKKQPSDLARILSDRGKALYCRGKLPAAGARYDNAVAIFTRLVEEEEGETYLADYIASSLSDRGDVLYCMEKLPEAVADYEKAIAIFTRLVEEEGETYLGDLLTLVRRKRAEIFEWSQDQGTSDFRMGFSLMH